MSKYFVNYSTYVIRDRAIPDVRDGLKPVQRRILFYALEENMYKDRKSAYIVGGVMANFHPHGDGSIYGTLVGMIQKNKNNIPMFNDQGNFGNLDDPAAAYRYTETHLLPATEMLTGDIKFVDYIPNYDGSRTQPAVLPSEVPWFWVNGTSGIAVGMGTEILPHNLGEIIDATLYLIDNPNCTPESLTKFVRCPDFPTGGYITPEPRGEHGNISSYITGKGSFRLRARIEKETEGKRKAIVIRELPYDIPNSRIIKQITSLVQAGKIQGIKNVLDESTAKEGMRIVIDLKAEAHPDIITNLLYQHTNCEIGVSMNTMGILDNQPMSVSLKRGLEIWFDFRRETVQRRFDSERQDLEDRLHILAGMIKIITNIDAVIKVVKTSVEPKKDLIAKFNLSDIQAEHVLGITIRRISKLGKDELVAEQTAKQARLVEVKAILSNDSLLNDVIKGELRAHRKKYAHPRRTKIVDSFSKINIADVTADDQVVVVADNQDNIKRVKVDEYRSQKRKGKGVLSSSGGTSIIVHAISVSAHDDLLVITNKGRAYYLKVYHLPDGNRTSSGAHISSLISIQADEKITALLGVDDLKNGSSLFLTTTNGVVKRVEASQFCKNRKAGLQVIGLHDDDTVIDVALIPADSDGCDVVLFSKDGFVLRFAYDCVREQGRGAGGVAGMRLQGDDKIVSVEVVCKGSRGEILTVTDKGFGKRFEVDTIPSRSGRGGKGVKSGHPSAGRLLGGFFIPYDNAKAKTVCDGTLFLSNNQGKCIRLPLDQTKKLQGRGGRGIKLQDMESDSLLVAATVVIEPQDIEEKN
jgi:DNA gyrase subunit A